MGQENSKPNSQPLSKTVLDLSNQFISELPNSVGNYSQLISVDLHQNALTSIESLSQLRTLTYLNVSNNELEMIHDMVLVNNSSLLQLIAEKNKITKITPLIGGLPLFKLSFANNLISIVPDTIGDCTCITYLCFAHNQIVEIPPTISRLSSLKQLIICGNKIKSIPPLERCPITHLDVADNELEIFPTTICKCPLIKLYLDNNVISSIPNEISLLVSLKELTLGTNVLRHLPKSLIHCVSLQSLDVENNELEEFYSTKPSVPEIFKHLAGSDPIPTLATKPLSRSKMERRKHSLEIQKQLQIDAKTRVYQPAPPRRLLIRIFGEGNAAWAVLTKCEKNDGSGERVTIYRNDCYVFDTGKKLIVFYGKETTKAKRNKTNQLIDCLKNEKGINQIDVIDGVKNKRTKSEELLKPFNAYFEIGYLRDKYKAKETMERISENVKVFVIALHRHGPQILLVPGRPSLKQLNSNTTVVIDTGVLVFVWCGKDASPTERTVAVLKAEELLDMSFRRRDKMEFVIEGAETQLFKEYFTENADGENERKVLGTEGDHQERMMYEDMLHAMLEDISLNPLDLTSNSPYLNEDSSYSVRESESEFDEVRDEDIEEEENIDVEEVRVITPMVQEDIDEIKKEKEHIKKDEIKKEKVKLNESKVFEIKIETPIFVKRDNKVVSNKEITEETEIIKDLEKNRVKDVVEEKIENIKPQEEVKNEKIEEVKQNEIEEIKITEKVEDVKPKDSMKDNLNKIKEVEVKEIIIEVKPKEEDVKLNKKEDEKPKKVEEDVKVKETKAEEIKPKEREAEIDIKLKEENVKLNTNEIEKPKEKIEIKIREPKEIKEVKINKIKEEIKPQEVIVSEEIIEEEIIEEISIEENKKEEVQMKPKEGQWKTLIENENVKTMDIKKRPTKKERTKGSKTVIEAQKIAVGSTKQTTEKAKATASVLAEDLLFQRKKLASAPTGNARDIKRLIHIKGKKKPFARLVECSWESLNSGDAFIFDSGKGAKCIYVWLGTSCNKMEKGKAIELSKLIAKERGGIKIETIDEDKEPKEFWKLFGEKQGSIRSAEDGGDDLVMELAQMKYVTLYKYWWDGLKEKVDIERWSYEGKEISKTVLENNSCYILDCYSEMYMWVGTKIIKDRRQQYIQDCQKRYVERRKEVWVAPLYFEFPGYEQAMFKERFCDFYEENSNNKKNTLLPFDDDKKIVRGSAVDYSMMLSKEIPIRKEVFIDNADGKKKIWRIDDFERVNASFIGEFFESESYIIQYTYIKWNNEYHILYFWQGRKCPVLDKGASARLTVDLHRKLKDEGKEYRIAQNTETNHFLSIFEFMVIRLGKDPNAKEDIKGKRVWEYDIIQNTKKEVKLVFDIRRCGVNLEHVKAVEIEQKEVANRLTSEGIFLITTESQTVIWKGKLTGNKELEFTKKLIEKYPDVQRKVMIEIKEGEETEEFWKIVGGKRILKEHNVQWKNRMFDMSSKSGVFAVEEITDWYQEDLESNSAMLLDCYDVCYLWVGKELSAIDKKFSMETVNEFIKRTKEEERTKRRCWLVYEGKEPFVFTNYFHGWRINKKQVVSVNDNLESCLEEVLKLTQTYSYDDLIHHRFPPGIDMSRLEHYLTDTDFEKVFKMSREEFEAQPLWKQQNQKHSLKLY